MLKVALVNLSADGRHAGIRYGSRELEVGAVNDLLSFLENFRQIDALENHEADPQLVISGRAGKFIVRSGQGRLLLFNARDPLEPFAELPAAAILDTIDRAPLPAPEREPTPATPISRSSSRGVAIAMLVAGLALNGYTLYSSFQFDDINRGSPVTLLTDEAESTRQRQRLSGTFATGNDPGDRGIVLNPAGTARFLEYGARGTVTSAIEDSFRLGTRNGRLCLLTAEGGAIEVINPDTLVYFRDVYRRTATPSP